MSYKTDKTYFVPAAYRLNRPLGESLEFMISVRVVLVPSLAAPSGVRMLSVNLSGSSGISSSKTVIVKVAVVYKT